MSNVKKSIFIATTLFSLSFSQIVLAECDPSAGFKYKCLNGKVTECTKGCEDLCNQMCNKSNDFDDIFKKSNSK